MKGKIYRIDKATGKLVEARPANELPAGPHVKRDRAGESAGMIVGPGGAMVSLPGARGLTEAQQLKNLSAVLDKADDAAEDFTDRRDILHVQNVIQKMREHYLD
jgi:hypothetical protein